MTEGILDEELNLPYHDFLGSVAFRLRVRDRSVPVMMIINLHDK